MKTRRLLGSVLVLTLLGVALAGAASIRGCGRPVGLIPPAPTAPKAPEWSSDEPAAPEPNPSLPPPGDLRIELPSEESPVTESPVTESPVTESPVAESPVASSQQEWPADFRMPRDLVFDDLPEVPEAIQGPSPPIDQPE